jgi:hypothetical protein
MYKKAGLFQQGRRIGTGAGITPSSSSARKKGPSLPPMEKNASIKAWKKLEKEMRRKQK